MAIVYKDDEFSFQVRLVGNLWQSGGAAITGGFLSTTLSASDLAEALAEAWLFMTPWLSDTCGIESVYVANENVSAEAAVVGGVGERSSESASPNTCPIVYLKSNGGKGPRFQGRQFIPGVLSEAGLSDTGVIDADFRADFMAAYEDYLEAMITEGAFAVILSRDGGTSPIPGASISVQNIGMRDRAATQRRRLRR